MVYQHSPRQAPTRLVEAVVTEEERVEAQVEAKAADVWAEAEAAEEVVAV